LNICDGGKKMKTVKKAIDTEINSEVIGGQPVCSILITKTALLEWIAVFWMILEEIGSVVITGKSGLKCSISLGDISSVGRGHDMLRIVMNKNDILCVGAYLLRYFRDDVAEVDHIDIEAIFQDRDGYIIFKVGEYLPSVSGEEARRRLGI
jgi:hypothetical protein